MIKFDIDDRGVILRYKPDFSGDGWLARDLEQHGEATLGRVFTFQTADVIPPPATAREDALADAGLAEEHRFRLATREGEYHRIPGRMLGIGSDVLIATSGIRIDRKLFIAERSVSILRRLSQVVGPVPEIVLGGTRDDAIPADALATLIAKFPGSTELDYYANARVAGVIGEYFDGLRDFRAQYEAYLSRRKSIARAAKPALPEVLRSEIDKYVLIRDTIKQWLAGAGEQTEKQWQTKILDFILLIFPKYVAVLENVRINDHYIEPGRKRNRFIDIALVDANGNVDVVEIKRPFDDVLLTKSRYRDNFVPTRELSGTIMQAEKYLFHLSKGGIDAEARLTGSYRDLLPPGLPIRITNPKALIIVGRDRLADGTPALSADQTFDLEFVRRKYANMMDILTYDDLLRRLDHIIVSLQRRLAEPGASPAGSSDPSASAEVTKAMIADAGPPENEP